MISPRFADFILHSQILPVPIKTNTPHDRLMVAHREWHMAFKMYLKDFEHASKCAKSYTASEFVNFLECERRALEWLAGSSMAQECAKQLYVRALGEYVRWMHKHAPLLCIEPVEDLLFLLSNQVPLPRSPK